MIKINNCKIRFLQSAELYIKQKKLFIKIVMFIDKSSILYNLKKNIELLK